MRGFINFIIGEYLRLMIDVLYNKFQNHIYFQNSKYVTIHSFRGIESQIPEE